jgi:hypothetical protein
MDMYRYFLILDINEVSNKPKTEYLNINLYQ